MARELDYNREIIYMLNQIRYEWRTNPVVLGGSSGSEGGSSGAPGGIIGSLSQRNVSGDTTQSFLFTSGSITSLVSNLNNIRAWLLPNHNFWADVTTPETTVISLSSGSWYYEDGKPPLNYLGGNSPVLSAPSSGSRYDLLTVNSGGVLAWTSSAEGNPPAYPTSFPTAASKQIPLWMILSRSSGSCIKRYDDGINHYIFRDERPFMGAPTYFPSTGSAYIDYQWYVDGALVAATDVQGVYYLADAFTLKGSYGYLKTTPSSGSVIVDIQYSTNNGGSWTSIYSGSTLTILAGDLSGSRTPDAIVLSAGTILRTNITNPGTGASTLSVNLYGTIQSASGGGTVTNVSATGTQGVTTSVANPTTTPSITIGLGAITPSSVAATGTVTGSNLSGTNTGDQTITLTGSVTGTGTSTIATTLNNTGVVADSYSNANITVSSDGRIISASSGSGNPISPSLPEDVAGTAFQGLSDFAAAGDHIHRGLHSVSIPGGTFIYGDAVLVPYAGVSITQSSGSLLLSATTGSGSLYPDPAYPVDSSSSSGSSGLASRGDHVHEGVHSVGVTSQLHGDVSLAAGTSVTLDQVGNTITINASASGTGFGFNGGRLTLDGTSPVGESNSSGSLYYLPYLGNSVEVYNGSTWVFIAFSSVSISLGGLLADKNYDVFAYDNSGNVALELNAWFDDYGRINDLNYIDNRLVKQGDRTRRYIGSVRINGDASTSQDSQQYRYLWNYFNRINRAVYVNDFNSHSYNGFWRDWNNSLLSMEFLRGYADEVQFSATLTVDSSVTSGEAQIAVTASAGTDHNICLLRNPITAIIRLSNTEYVHNDTNVVNNPIGRQVYSVQEQTQGGGTGTFEQVTLSGIMRM